MMAPTADRLYGRRRRLYGVGYMRAPLFRDLRYARRKSWGNLVEVGSGRFGIARDLLRAIRVAARLSPLRYPR